MLYQHISMNQTELSYSGYLLRSLNLKFPDGNGIAMKKALAST